VITKRNSLLRKSSDFINTCFLITKILGTSYWFHCYPCLQLLYQHAFYEFVLAFITILYFFLWMSLSMNYTLWSFAW